MSIFILTLLIICALVLVVFFCVSASGSPPSKLLKQTLRSKYLWISIILGPIVSLAVYWLDTVSSSGWVDMARIAAAGLAVVLFVIPVFCFTLFNSMRFLDFGLLPLQVFPRDRLPALIFFGWISFWARS